MRRPNGQRPGGSQMRAQFGNGFRRASMFRILAPKWVLANNLYFDPHVPEIVGLRLLESGQDEAP